MVILWATNGGEKKLAGELAAILKTAGTFSDVDEYEALVNHYNEKRARHEREYNKYSVVEIGKKEVLIGCLERNIDETIKLIFLLKTRSVNFSME